MKIIIDGYRGPFIFLSNAYRADVEYEGRVYPTVEHAVQAARTLDDGQRAVIQQAPTAHIARQMGGLVTPRPDWEEVKDDILYELTHQKFTRHPDLRAKLLRTQGMVLAGEGGAVLMRVREELGKDSQQNGHKRAF